MSLWYSLRIGSQQIGWMEIQRREHLDLSDTASAEAVCTYDVRIDDKHVATVRHRYGDGAWALLRKAVIAGVPG